jgi:5'-phosphate synthase pdxT subunit
MGLEAYGLEQPIRDFVAAGRPVLGTCAGLIVLDRAHLGLMDVVARRNAFGRQVRSFEADVPVRGLGDEPLRAVFIRAPWIEAAGEGVEVLAEVDGHPVVARQGNMLVAAFHPELTDDLRLHALFLAMVGEHGTNDLPETSAARSRSAQS